MPGSTFLPIAGPVGTAAGIAAGAVVMLVLAVNYHYLMNHHRDGGGTYTYTKKCFGYDHGFLSAWFLILTYIAIIWANATALPLIARTLLGGFFQFGFDYEIAGYHVYFGELILAAGALLLSGLICLHRRLSQSVQIIAAVALLAGALICFVFGMLHARSAGIPLEPSFAPGKSIPGSIFTIFALAPWAYVGFESISHSTGEMRFSVKKSFLIMAAAVAAAALAYAALAVLAVTALPEGCSSWAEYTANLGNYSGLASQPTFFATNAAMGNAGSILLGIAALGGIFTGIIGHSIALSRLLCTLGGDGMFPEWIGETDENGVPRRAVFCIVVISIVLPFFGRTAISWIVDVTTVGAVIAYAFTAACSWKTARTEKNSKMMAAGVAGLIISILFALAFLVPNILSVTTLSTESYLILAAWGILGFAVFRLILSGDRMRRMGRSIVAWVVLLALILFTSSVWMRQTSTAMVEQSVTKYVSEREEASAGAGPADGDEAQEEVFEEPSSLQNTLDQISSSIRLLSLIQAVLIVAALLILLDIYQLMQKRERQIEVEKVLAEESSRAKTSFLSNMSHEIRTPMNAIIGLDNIALRDPNLSPRTREQLEKIGSSAKHLLGLINDILDMSRIESGRMILKNEDFSFREFLDQINIMINGQCQDKGLRYECQIIGPVSDYYCGDDMKLKQVLINILGNSVKFTDAPGVVSLTVEQLSRFDGMCAMRFTMKDTGIGMDEEYIPKIFEAFSQEDTTTTNMYGGSGLGMSITKNFVEMMNGEIDVKSRKGEGSVFTVIVTLKESERSSALEQEMRLPEGLRAMVVDDDEIACEHTQVVLNGMGIEAVTYRDPSLALQGLKEACAQGRPYNLLFTDYKMPQINGLELVRSVRSFDEGRTAVIMLTGYNWDIIDEEAREEGVDGIMAKPLFPDSLSREISCVLSMRPGEDQAPAEALPQEEQILAGRRVLMAEDVEQNAEILQDLLELEEMTAEHARNGEIAVQMFSESSPGWYDLILMDVRMPVMDGLSATRAIRDLDRDDAKSIPIIAMTANVFDEDVERSLQAGMNAHLSKPVEPDRLYATMAELLRGKKPL